MDLGGPNTNSIRVALPELPFSVLVAHLWAMPNQKSLGTEAIEQWRPMYMKHSRDLKPC